MRLFDHRRSLFIISFFFLILFLTVFYFNQIALYAFSKIYNFDISYKKLAVINFKEIKFDDLRVTDKKRGIGIFSRDAVIKPGVDFKRIGSFLINFDLRGVYFLKRKDELPDSYDNLSGLISIPFSSRWTYEDISGELRICKDRIDLAGLVANSDKVKLYMKGILHSYDIMESEIVIYFSGAIVNKMPEGLSNVILQGEEGGWKSLSVTLSGNYRTPSIKVTGKLFRLNIGTIPESKQEVTPGKIAF